MPRSTTLILLRLGALSGALSLALASCEGGCTTASLAEPTITAKVDPSTKKPLAPTDRFTPDAPAVYCTVKLLGAPEGTKVTGKWIATKVIGAPPGHVIHELSITAGGDRYLAFTLTKPTKGWPVGDYEVKLQIENGPATSATFKVGPAAGASPTGAKTAPGQAPPSKAPPASAEGGVTFTKKVPAPGMLRSDRSRMEMELEIDVLQGGRVVAKMDNSNDARSERRLKVLAADGRAATKVEVTYLAKREIESSGKKRKKTTSPLEGKTLIVSAEGGRLVVTDAKGGEVPAALVAAAREDNSSVGQPNRFAALLPDRPLRVGEALKPSAAVIRELLGADKAEMPLAVERVAFTLKGVTRAGGATHGLFDVTMKLAITKPPMTIGMTLAGQLTVDTATSWPVRFEVKGPLTVSGRQGRSKIAGKGRTRISLTATYGGDAAAE